MSISRDGFSAFTQNQDNRSDFFCNSDLGCFDKLKIDDSDSQKSHRSNASHVIRPTAVRMSDNSSIDCMSVSFRNRKKSHQLNLQPSVPGNRTFLNNSLYGKSSSSFHLQLNSNQLEDPRLEKQLSEKSCPDVGRNISFLKQRKSYDNQIKIEQQQFEEYSNFQKKSRNVQNMNYNITESNYEYINQSSMPKRKQTKNKKYNKTKNFPRTMSINLHKYIKHSFRAKQFIMKYWLKINAGETFEKVSNQNLVPYLKIKSLSQKKIKQIAMKQENLNYIVQTISIDENLKQHLEEAEIFYERIKQWVSKFNMINFGEYERIWTTQCEFKSVYRQICYKYYVEEAVCDIQNSRLENKSLFIQHIAQFIQGLLNPRDFYQFK